MEFDSGVPNADLRQGALDAIVRGVEGFRIPAATDWSTASHYLADNDGQWKFSAVLVAIVTRREPTKWSSLRPRDQSGLQPPPAAHSMCKYPQQRARRRGFACSGCTDAYS